MNKKPKGKGRFRDVFAYPLMLVGFVLQYFAVRIGGVWTTSVLMNGYLKAVIMWKAKLSE